MGEAENQLGGGCALVERLQVGVAKQAIFQGIKQKNRRALPKCCQQRWCQFWPGCIEQPSCWRNRHGLVRLRAILRGLRKLALTLDTFAIQQKALQRAGTS